MRVLIAEDERITRLSLQRKLAGWGHDVVAVADGAEAWDRFKKEHFDLVLTDWEMPFMDGRELIEHIRRCDRSSYTYLIMLTGRADKADIVSGMETGADDFVTKPFDTSELEVRIRAGQRIVELERDIAARNEELQAANSRMKRDLEAAARIQESLLPQSIPDIPKARIAWRYLPCDELAGDALNVFTLDPDHVAFYLSDVTGHGVPASLLSFSVARSLVPSNDPYSVLRTSDQHSSIASPAELTARLNELFPMELNGNLVFTIHFGILHWPTMKYTYSSAGHPGPILLRTGEEAVSLDLHNFPIGVLADAGFEEETIQLKPGDRLYIHSDGVNEEMDKSSTQFGRERLRQTLCDLRTQSLENSVDSLVNTLRQWNGNSGFSDDVSIIGIEIC